MAIDIQNPDSRIRLSKAIQYAHSQQGVARARRNTLVRIHNDDDDVLSAYMPKSSAGGTFINYFQMFVRGQILTLAYQNPKWSVDARMVEGRGFDKRVEMFLGRYFDALNFNPLIRQLAADTSFGRAVVKIVNGMAPKGVYSPYAPRVYRVNPNDLIIDESAESFDTAMFIADMYLVPLDEARENKNFNPSVAQYLQPYKNQTADSRPRVHSDDAYAEDLTRLIDVYIPAKGIVATFPCNVDTFGDIMGEPLETKDSPVNPYEVCELVFRPDSVEELSRLWGLREPHFLANDMWHKTARQARQSRRNPVDKMGNSEDLSSIQTSPDGEAVFLNDPTSLDLYTLPGPDASVVQTGMMAAQQFSQQAGNLEVAMGINPGAPTARQTNAIMGQISAVQSYDRGLFERFLSNIGKKVATLAFHSQVLELTMMGEIPGTPFAYNIKWAPPHMLPRVGTVDDYSFDVVPYSTGYRNPMERLTQLNEASMGLMNWFTAMAQGAPIDIGSVLKSYQRAYDLIELQDWWNGKQPTPTEQAANAYSSTAAPPQGSTLTYESNAGGGGDPLAAFQGQSGGLGGG